MVLQWKDLERIEDPRNYGPSIVNDLRNLLTAGVLAHPDPQRENFYELDSGDSTFYIHISPISGDAVLLAKWSSSPKATAVPASICAA
jgi:hypothetical protein